MFGQDGRYHPNQLVAKKYLPPEGLCTKNLMYKLACKISDLRYLAKCNRMAMDPFDLIRWRLVLQLGKRPHSPLPYDWDGSTVCHIIMQMFEYNEGHYKDGKERRKEFADPVLREAIIASAILQQRVMSFLESKESEEKGVNAQKLAPVINERLNLRRHYIESSRAKPPPGPIHPETPKPRPPPVYRGVNDYRKGQQERGVLTANEKNSAHKSRHQRSQSQTTQLVPTNRVRLGSSVNRHCSSHSEPSQKPVHENRNPSPSHVVNRKPLIRLARSQAPRNTTNVFAMEPRTTCRNHIIRDEMIPRVFVLSPEMNPGHSSQRVERCDTLPKEWVV